MKINAQINAHEIQNNAQSSVHYYLKKVCILFRGVLRQLTSIANHFSLHTRAGVSGYFRTHLDESYRILPPSQNPQNPIPNPSNTKTLERMYLRVHIALTSS